MTPRTPALHHPLTRRLYALLRVCAGGWDVVTFPLKLIVAAYGSAALAGIGVMLGGGGAFGAVLTVWLGGAVAVFVLPALPIIGAGFRQGVEETALFAGSPVGRSLGSDAGAPAWARANPEFDRWDADLALEALDARLRAEDAAQVAAEAARLADAAEARARRAG